MDKIIKTGLEFGVGIAAITAEALTEAVNKLEKEGRINKKDSEKMVREVIQRYQAKGSRYAKEVQAQFDTLKKASPFATKKDIASLNAKIDKISKLVKKGRK